MTSWARYAGAAALLCILACSKSELAPRSAPAAKANSLPITDPAAENYALPQLPHARVTLKDVYGGTHPVDVEVAASDEATTRGMMWRARLDEGKGMLFIFPDEKVRAFWMRNTLVPLDMLFIGADKKIVGIVEQAVPQTLTSRSVGVPSKYVLEVPGGWSAKSGVKSGSPVEIETR
jgi:uncharacterized membrane protein (UPF0127 family)